MIVTDLLLSYFIFIGFPVILRASILPAQEQELQS